MPAQRAPAAQRELRGPDEQRERDVEIAVRDPAEHRNPAPLAHHMRHAAAPVVIVVFDPCVGLLHVIVVHVIAHRHVWRVEHVEIAV